MDPNTSIGRLCLGDNNYGSLAEGSKKKEQWNGPEFQDTTESKRKSAKVFIFYRMEEEGEQYSSPCYVGGLHANDGEINLAHEKNLVSNEFAVKMWEFYFVKFIINPEEEDVKLGVILGRSFIRLAKGVVDFRNGIITIHPDFDLLCDGSEEAEKDNDDWELMFDLKGTPELKSTKFPPYVCKMGKSARIKKRALDSLQIYYPYEGPSRSSGKPMTHEEATRQELVLSICQKYALLEEYRPVLEIMAYSDKYSKIFDEIVIDKIKLDGMLEKEEEEAIIKVKGEALKEKNDPWAFFIPIRLEARINLNALVDNGSEINVMPYRVYQKLRREEVKRINRDITMINHIKAKSMGMLKDVICQVGIIVGRGFLHTCGGILNTRERITSTFNGVCHQTFRAAKIGLDTSESDSDDEVDCTIKRNKFGAPIYDCRIAYPFDCSNKTKQALALQTVINPLRKVCVWKKAVSFLGSLPVPLEHLEWKLEYQGCHSNEEEATGQWRIEIRFTDPYGNVYMQGFTTKKTTRRLSKYQKLSDIMSPNYTPAYDPPY
ncbi:hypothetical protein Tco_1200326 [Tanacetum coccineum]